MKHNVKKLLSLILALSMVLSLMSVSVFADEEVVEINNLNADIAKANKGKTVKLTDNITLSANLIISTNSNVLTSPLTIDLNGHTLALGSNKLAANGGALTIKDTSGAGTGKITHVGSSSTQNAIEVATTAGSALTILGGTIEELGTADLAKPLSVSGGTISISGGRFLKNGSSWTINENWIAEGYTQNAEGWIVEDSAGPVTAENAIAKIGDDNYYESLEKALKAATDLNADCTITMLQNGTIDSNKTLNNGKEITINLNGHDVEFTSTSQNRIDVNSGTLTLTGEGNFKHSSDMYNPVIWVDSGTLNVGEHVHIRNVSLKSKSTSNPAVINFDGTAEMAGSFCSDTIFIDFGSNSGMTTVNIGGTADITGSIVMRYAHNALNIADGAKIESSSNRATIWALNGTLNIHGGTITNTAGSYVVTYAGQNFTTIQGAAIAVTQNVADGSYTTAEVAVTIDGEPEVSAVYPIVIMSPTAEALSSDKLYVHVKGGTYTGTAAAVLVGGESSVEMNADSLVITGGTFTMLGGAKCDVSAYYNTASFKQLSNGKIVGINYTPPAQINDQDYDSLEAAIADSDNNASITVNTAATLGSGASTVEVPANSTVKAGASANKGSASVKQVEITGSDSSTTTAYVVSGADGTTSAIAGNAIGNTVTGAVVSENEETVEVAATDYDKLFDMTSVLAGLAAEAGTAVSDVSISMSAVDQNKTIHEGATYTKTFEVHPVATGGGASYVIDETDELLAESYNVTMTVGTTADAGKFAKLTHYAANGTEELGIFPIKSDGSVDFTMSSFSVVGVTVLESSYYVSITDTETAYDAASTTESKAAGESITMYVKLNDANSAATQFIYGAGTITYDPALVELTGVTLNSGFTALKYTSGGFDLTDNGDGTITFEAKQKDGSAGAAITSGGTLYTLTFTVLDSIKNDTTKLSQTAAFAVTNANAATVADTAGNKKASSTVGDNVTILMSFDTSVTDEAGTTTTGTAVYNRDYTYQIAGYGAAYTYIVDVTVNGSAYNATPDENGKITIPGSDVIGVVTISVSKISVAVHGDYVDGWYMVKVTDAGGSDRKFQFDAGTNNMFKVTRGSDTYYAILVSEGTYGENKTSADFASLVKVGSDVRGTLSIPTLDVNGTGSNDYNDYLRVFVCYEEKADVVTYMADYIRADYDGDNKADATDFTDVYNAINNISG